MNKKLLSLITSLFILSTPITFAKTVQAVQITSEEVAVTTITPKKIENEINNAIIQIYG